MKRFRVEIWSGKLYGDGGLLCHEQVDDLIWDGASELTLAELERLPNEMALEGYGSMARQ